MIKTSAYFVIIIFLFSCSTDDDNIPYYNFSENEKPFLLDNYNNSSKRLVFKNQENEEFSFIYKSFEEYKNSYSYVRGGFGPVFWGPPNIDFFYDVRKIEFTFEQVQEPRADLKFSFNKFSDTLKGGIQFPLWNIVFK